VLREKRIGMKKPEENQMRKKILVDALSRNLSKMSKTPWVRSFKEGKDLICPHCSQPVQPCKSDPSAMCDQMLLTGTEGRELENALKNPIKGNYGTCLSCGKQISTSHLKKHPTAEVCSGCIQKERRIHSRKSVQTR
jgi:hypothetical protein